MKTVILLLATAAGIQPVHGQTVGSRARTFTLESIKGLEPVNVMVEASTYRGRRAVRLLERDSAASQSAGGPAIAVLTDSDFGEGTVELMVAGTVRPGADAGARGFIGLAFHIEPDNSHFQTFYLRPTNGRATEQLRRNHAVQYTSEPDFPWARLRKENPDEYESYADMEPGVWTRMKIVVSAKKAELFVNGAEQPSLVVNDFKAGAERGRLALWIGPGTDGYFTNLTVR
ncbi:MAG: hypothetical protein ABI647_14460 [Gemmatimonadota bacterium]